MPADRIIRGDVEYYLSMLSDPLPAVELADSLSLQFSDEADRVEQIADVTLPVDVAIAAMAGRRARRPSNP